MKTFLMIGFLVLSSTSAYADAGNITCTTTEPVKLEFEEMSDISEETLRLDVNDQKIGIEEVQTSSTDYGILSISILTGPSQDGRKYNFENLGSSDCFGVYESNQEGPAKVEVISPDGKLEAAECTCTVD